MGVKMAMTNEKGIHHFPGHMAKALKRLAPFIKGSDLIVEVCDARAPLSSRNPFLGELIGAKPRLLVLSKTDLADPAVSEMWFSYFHEQKAIAFGSDLTKVCVLELLKKASAPLIENKRAKERRLGMKTQSIRLLVLGAPNVGKSTLINNLAHKRVAIAQNKPGVTRAEQWIKISDDFVLLDTPGILPMNYEDKRQALRLALLGSIKEEILPLDELGHELLAFLRERYPFALAKRSSIPDLRALDDERAYREIAMRRNFLALGGGYDLQKALSSFLKDFKEGAYGRISLERPDQDA